MRPVEILRKAKQKRQEAERARGLANAMLSSDRERLLAYAEDLEKEAAELEHRAEDSDDR